MRTCSDVQGGIHPVSSSKQPVPHWDDVRKGSNLEVLRPDAQGPSLGAGAGNVAGRGQSDENLEAEPVGEDLDGADDAALEAQRKLRELCCLLGVAVAGK